MGRYAPRPAYRYGTIEIETCWNCRQWLIVQRGRRLHLRFSPETGKWKYPAYGYCPSCAMSPPEGLVWRVRVAVQDAEIPAKARELEGYDPDEDYWRGEYTDEDPTVTMRVLRVLERPPLPRD